MSKLLDFTLKFGSSARLRNSSESELAEEMRHFGFSEDEIKSLLKRDMDFLSKINKENGKIYCVLMPEKPDDEKEKEKEKEDESEEKSKDCIRYKSVSGI